jgi:hypothetical protein
VDGVAFCEEQLGEVGAILTGDAGDEGDGHGVGRRAGGETGRQGDRETGRQGDKGGSENRFADDHPAAAPFSLGADRSPGS